MVIRIISVVSLVLAAMVSVAFEKAKDSELTAAVERAITLVKPLHKAIEKPGPMDWLSHHKEPGQTFSEYIKSEPVTPSAERRKIYVQPLGDFTKKQRQILKNTSDFLGCFYNLPVVVKDVILLSVIPDGARRTHPQWGMKQILSTYVLDNVLYPKLPDDAAMYLAFTSSDLWPGQGWNFVFGQASLRQRVGVWSLYRFGNPDESKEAELLCLRRTLKLATHETGHMFSILHCTAYECGMCGSNHMEESDKRPLLFCPECMAKVCWATKVDPKQHFEAMQKFLKTAGLAEEAESCRKTLEALSGKEKPGIQ